METFSALLAICAGNSAVTGEFPAQRTVTRSFDVFFDLHLNKAWVNNREAGDLRRHRANYVNIMWILVWDAIWRHGSWSTLNQLLSPDGTKPLSVPVFTWTNENKLEWNSHKCTIILIQENADDYVGKKICPILLRRQSVKDYLKNTRYYHGRKETKFHTNQTKPF